MKTLFISQEELEKYQLTLSKRNRIHKFWLDLFRLMPQDLKKELRGKPTNLILQQEGEFEIIGAKSYQFETLKASDELSRLLNEYVIFVEVNDEKTYKSKYNAEIVIKLKRNTGF